jgi:hypothetical protein
MSARPTNSTSRMNRASEPYKVVAMRTIGTAPEVFPHADAVEAIATGVEYLRRGYWVRLSDYTLAAFEADHHMLRLRDQIAQRAKGGHV